ncbi:unnamed protein product [Orchesella dallaii]|uniref:Uncharacterized protein n=1 Tax=Orchesella dallaii TaxID=48710 RepID=A0ABP1Q9N6_9HEXA
MSDTDDTDALLTCDPSGGLRNLLSMTMEGISTSQLDSQSLDNSNLSEQDSKSKSNGNHTTETSNLEISDFFNSEGELVLSGLSQFSDASDSDSHVTETKDESSIDNANIEGDDADDESDSSVETNTVVPTVSKSKSNNVNKPNNSDSVKEVNENGKLELSNNSIIQINRKVHAESFKNKIDPCATVPEEIQADLKRQLLHANRKNPGFQNWLESGESQVTYGVLNLNLNDLKTFAEGLSRTNIFPPSPKVSTFVRTTNDKGEQVFTRAPNFRTPGGYRPSKNPKPCRDLTDEQIREEVRKMYAFPDANDEEDDNKKQNDSSIQKTPVEKDSSEAETKDNVTGDPKVIEDEQKSKPKVEFDFMHGTPIPNEFGKGKTGKPIKRKLLPNGGGVCGGTIGSIPDLGFGIRDFMSKEKEVDEPVVERSTSWVTGASSSTSTQEKPTNSSEFNTNTEKQPQRFTFGYGDEENMLSPIRSSVIKTTGFQVNSSLLQSQRLQPSPAKSNDSSSASQSDLFASASASPICDKASSKNGSKYKGTSSNTSNAIIVTKPEVIGGTKAHTSKRRVIKKAATKFRGMASHRSPKGMEGSEGRDAVPVESIASDLEKILSEYELPAEELEALINNLDDEDIDLTAVEFIESDEADGNFVDALSQLKLNDWSNDESYNEMYHAEKFKREQCEKELHFLQQSVLSEKQQNAVLEGTLKRRNMMLVQITMAFNRVCKEWKKFDSESKATVNKLQHDQKLLAAACKHSKDRISQYEKELHKTVELADSFKSKLVDVQMERDESVQTLKKANSELEEKIAKLKDDMEMLRNERDATLRALRESQIRLDEGKISFEKMEAHLKDLEEKDNESCQKYEELLQAKSQQESSYIEVVARQKELETLVMNLTMELNQEKASKEQLKRDLHDEAERKTRAEAERLHDYYNKKVQEILKSATEEAARAEAALKDQIKRASVESERKLTECKERFQRDMDMLKAKYEAEIDRLKRENLHKQLLISSTVKQLQMGDSPNLEVNSLNMPNRTPYQKEGFDIIKGHHSKDSCGSHSKSGYSQFSKFTLDHIPQSVIVPSAHHSMENTPESMKSKYEEIPFEAGKLLARFKTSTPVESHGPRNHNDGAAGDGRSVKSSTSDEPAKLLEKKPLLSRKKNNFK